MEYTRCKPAIVYCRLNIIEYTRFFMTSPVPRNISCTLGRLYSIVYYITSISDKYYTNYLATYVIYDVFNYRRKKKLQTNLAAITFQELTDSIYALLTPFHRVLKWKLPEAYRCTRSIHIQAQVVSGFCPGYWWDELAWGTSISSGLHTVRALFPTIFNTSMGRQFSFGASLPDFASLGYLIRTSW